MAKGRKEQTSIIALERFIQSTRDSGYKNTGSAVAELADNALQANAKHIDIYVRDESLDNGSGLSIAVLDDGDGMSVDELRQSLRFGGSSRFNDRTGMGRYGMGLPNASLSQAQKVTVYSWKNNSAPLSVYLDVTEIANGDLVEIPIPTKAALPSWLSKKARGHGSLVVWDRCDRIENRRAATIVRKLQQSLGQVFRYFLLNGTDIRINGSTIDPIDPLFLDKTSLHSGARIFEKPWRCEISANPKDPGAGIGTVTITFSELPVSKWHALSNEEKRAKGISNGAGVSIVRGRREIDFGWFFMGNKRRENYDDWWRCEIRFEPTLDEAFGITHTKQQVRPKDYLVEALTPHIETVAKALNARVRQAHLEIKTRDMNIEAEHVAAERDGELRPLPGKRISPKGRQAINALAKKNNTLASALEAARVGSTSYKIIEDEGCDTLFFRPLVAQGLVVGVLNPRHRFYKALYKPLFEQNGNGKGNGHAALGRAIQLLLLSAARAEATFTEQRDFAALERFRREWSETLDVLLREE